MDNKNTNADFTFTDEWDAGKGRYAIGFAAGVDVALGLAGRITDGEGE